MQTAEKALHDKATEALNRGDMRGMAQCCEAILRLDPEFADGWFLLSIAAEARREIARAIQLVDKAIALQANNAEYLSQKARFHTLINQPEAATDAATQALALQPQSALTLDTLGVVFTRLGSHRQAAEALRQAVALQPGNAQFHFNLAAAEQILGHAAAAGEHYQQAIALRPGFARAYWALSELYKNRSGDSQQLVRILALQQQQELSPEDTLYLGHAAAREYEHRGEYDKSFQQLVRAKSQRLRQLDYTIDRDEVLFKAMQRAFPINSATAPPPGRTMKPAPLFIVGMPRSGTTLVEQVLASHPDIASLGELQAMTHAVKLCSGSRSAHTLDEEVIRGALAAPANCIAERYFAALRTRLGALECQPRYVIDKMPLNFLYLGFILRSLPDAKVICVRRHPLDTCLSNFRQLFAVNFSYYNYHYDLGNTTAYYILFHQLMRHWQTVFGDRVLELPYEALTATPEATAKTALAYLDLPWDPACLRFHEQRSAVATASAMQVREPIYTTAVGRWQHYAKQLEPAMALLDAAGISYRDQPPH
jgi:tetratricopeptide (TPR) repeat protein